ncbi:MAG: glycosyltransferase family 4 protein [Pseudomonadota bacterium]
MRPDLRHLDLTGKVILQVIPALDTGGAEQTTLDVAEAVVKAGGRALVASRGGRMNEQLKARGGELIPLPLHSKAPGDLIFCARQLLQAIRRHKVSLVHVRSRAPAYPAFWAARRAHVPMLATYHGVYNARSPLKRWYNSIMTRGDLTIANSDYTRAHVLAEHGTTPERVISIPRGVDLTRFTPELVSPGRVALLRRKWALENDPRPVALLAGRLTRWKGQTLAIEALGRLKAQGRDDLILVLAGDDQGRGEYSAELHRLTRDLGVADQVRFAGHVADMPAAYLAADFALAPSLEPEAFGRTAVEPQVMGRLVLAANHGAATETVIDGETGFLLPPGDVGAWAEGLKRALDLTPEDRAAMTAAAAERSRRLYSLEAMTEATLAVYQRLLSGAA